MTDKIKSRNSNNFDFLRIYFTFVVFIAHLVGLPGIQGLDFFFYFFPKDVAVPSFFIISGFLITSSYVRANSLKEYFIKRARRVLPAYIFVISLSGVFLSLISQYSIFEYFKNIGLYRYLAANLTFLNFIEPCLPGVFTKNNSLCAVNGSLWTLKIEVAFYLTIPILVFITKRINKKYVLFIAMYGMSILYRNGLQYLSNRENIELFNILSRQLPGFFSYFISGVACYYYYDLFLQHKRKLFMLGILLFMFEYVMSWEILTPFALSLIVLTIAFSFKKLNNFGKFGDFSYGVYIFHFPIIQLAIHLGFFDNRQNPYIVFCCIIFIVSCMGFLSWHLLEKPFMECRYISKIGRKRS